MVALNGPEAERRRLESIGIIPGAEVGILANGIGPVLLSVGESRIALERDVAAHVLVA